MTTALINLAAVLLLLAGCSSSGDLLEQWSEQGQVADSESLNSPEFHALTQTLEGLGYQGVGLRYETEETQKMLRNVFQDPRVAGRQIRLVYTGLALSYDSKQASLTIGGTSDPAAIIAYIEKQIPKVKK